MRVLFLLQRPEAWANLATVHDAMTGGTQFEPVVWQLPYNMADPETSSRKDKQTRAVLEAAGIAYAAWQDGLRLNRGDFSAVVFGHPYDRERPTALAFERVAAAVDTTVYIPYGMQMGGGRKNLRLQYAQPTQIGVSAIVARSQEEKDQYRRHCPRGNGHVHVTGHPRFDCLLAGLQAPPPQEQTDFVGGRKAVLWNSHFSFAPEFSQLSNFSTFDLIGPELFELAIQQRNDLCLIWRPHPGMWTVLLRHGLLADSDIQPLRDELAVNGIWLDQSHSHIPAFATSDALLTDSGSFLIEYLATRKPILALRNPEGEPYNEEAQALVSAYPVASRPDDVAVFVDRVLKGQQQSPARQVLDKHLPMLDGRAGQRVTALIALLCGAPAPEFPVQSRNIRQVLQPLFPSYPAWQQHASALPTPILDRLCEGLRAIRRRKAAESVFRKRGRTLANNLRTSASEWLKQHPNLDRALATARSFHGKVAK